MNYEYMQLLDEFHRRYTKRKKPDPHTKNNYVILFM